MSILLERLQTLMNLDDKDSGANSSGNKSWGDMECKLSILFLCTCTATTV